MILPAPALSRPERQRVPRDTGVVFPASLSHSGADCRIYVITNRPGKARTFAQWLTQRGLPARAAPLVQPLRCRGCIVQDVTAEKALVPMLGSKEYPPMTWHGAPIVLQTQHYEDMVGLSRWLAAERLAAREAAHNAQRVRAMPASGRSDQDEDAE